MLWLDDAILDNPKLSAVGPVGLALYIAGLTYCARNLTDGFIPYGQSRVLLPLRWLDPKEQECRVIVKTADVSLEGDALLDHVTALLTEAVTGDPLWERVSRGFLVHDYLKHNLSREQVVARREATRTRVARHYQRHSSSSNGGSNGVANGVRNADITTPPVPVKDSATQSRKSTTATKEQLVRFTSVWNEHRGALPLLRKPPDGKLKADLIGRAWVAVEGDETLLGRAITEAGADDFYVQKGYGFETFCRHPERWIGKAAIAKPERQVLTGDALL